MTKPAALALEDGLYFRGTCFGAEGERAGELVFNTSMSGYQEILTDPSYKGQIVVMTCPMIGNYGVNDEDPESAAPQVEGFVVKEASRMASNWRATSTLRDYLKEHRIVGIEGIDTRYITRHIRSIGAMRAVLSTEDLDRDSLVEKAKQVKPMAGSDFASIVTCSESYDWSAPDGARFRVAAMDFGCKRMILRCLAEVGCAVRVFPAQTSAEEILDWNPDGIFLSNGPGDPAAVTYAIETVRKLLGARPMFGICLGHQILGLALGGNTFKLKFGHRGANQPVMELSSGQIDITAQNHGFAVDPNSLDESEIEVTHINLNDQTVEGLRHRHLPIYAVQYHPEAAPGPHDARHLFQRFVHFMESRSSGKN